MTRLHTVWWCVEGSSWHLVDSVRKPKLPVLARFYRYFRYTTNCLVRPQQVQSNVNQSQPKKWSQVNQWSIKSGSRAIWIVGGQIGLGADRHAGRNGNTLLSDPVADQAALHGLLRKVRDLGMPLISVIQPEKGERVYSASAGEAP